MALVEVTDLVKIFEKKKRKPGIKGALKDLFRSEKTQIRAVDGVSFEIKKGEIVGYIGPNGAGKSTTVKILTGILTPTSGKAIVDGLCPYEKRKENAQKIGVVFGQRSRLWHILPVYDSFLYTKALYSIPDSVYKRNLDYFKEKLNLDRILDQQVRTLSLGERMRAELAMAMLHSPKIIYLDEPTVGLDVVGKNELRKMIKTLNEEQEVTVLLVTHDVIDIEKMCTRAIILDKGKVTWLGTMDELRHFHGNTRLITAEYVEAPGELEAAGIECLIREGEKLQYRVDISAVAIDEAIRIVSGVGRIADIKIAETEIEEVIRRIYTG